MVEPSTVYTVDEALSRVGFGKFQWLVLGYAGLGWISEAMEVMILSFIGTEVKSKWHLSPTQESLISTVVFGGMLLGAFSWGLISDTFGRRKGLLSVAVVTAVAGLGSSFSPNYATLIVLRCLVGFGLGGGPVYSSWFLEFIPTPKRGMWMVIFANFWTVGTLFEASLAWIVMPRLGWRWLVGLSSIPCFIALALYGPTPESPRYLCAKGKMSEAREILEKLAKLNNKTLPSGKLITDHDVETNEGVVSTSADTDLVLKSKSGAAILKEGFRTIIVLLSSKLYRTTLSVWILFFGNAFSYYGLILLTSKLSSKNNDCVSSSEHKKHLLDTNVYLNVFITTLAEFPGLVVSGFLVDKIGRKLSMGIMFGFGCIFIFPLIFQMKEIPMLVLLFGARMCMMATITIANIYAPEIYPTPIRSTGYGVASAVGRIGGMVCPFVAVGLVTGCHQRTAIFLFEGVIVLSALSILLLPLETKGRNLVDSVEHATD